MIWVCFPGTNRLIQVESAGQVPLRSDLRVRVNGREVRDAAALAEAVRDGGGVVSVTRRDDGLAGGKGGFGSLLRSKKSTVKTTNFGACRDLSGRRLRHVEQERALAAWHAGAAQRELEKRRAQLEAAEARGAGAGERQFADPTFAQETVEFCDSVAEAVRKRVRGKDEEEEEEEDQEEEQEEQEEQEEEGEKKKAKKRNTKKLFDDDEYGGSSE